MYWRNRLNFNTQNNASKLKASIPIGDEAIFLWGATPQLLELNNPELPDTFVIQVIIKPTYKINNETFVKANSSASPMSVYHNSNMPAKAIEKINLLFDAFIYNPEKNTHWQEKVKLPPCVYEISFDTLDIGTFVFHQEKRLPQEKIPEQSLWSYGATYSTDFDLCQVVQTKILPICVNNATLLQYERLTSPHTVGDKILNGAIKLAISPDDIYQSYFIKNITPKIAHLYMKKIQEL